MCIVHEEHSRKSTSKKLSLLNLFFLVNIPTQRLKGNVYIPCMHNVRCTMYIVPYMSFICNHNNTNNQLTKAIFIYKKTIRKNSVERSCGSWKTDRNVFKNQPPHLLRYLFSDNTVQCARVLSQSQDDHYRYSRPGDSLSVGCTFTMGNIQDHMTF